MGIEMGTAPAGQVARHRALAAEEATEQLSAGRRDAREDREKRPALSSETQTAGGLPGWALLSSLALLQGGLREALCLSVVIVSLKRKGGGVAAMEAHESTTRGFKRGDRVKHESLSDWGLGERARPGDF
jgi:hypothetical protein